MKTKNYYISILGGSCDIVLISLCSVTSGLTFVTAESVDTAKRIICSEINIIIIVYIMPFLALQGNVVLKIFRSSLSTQFQRHCVLSDGNQRRAQCCYQTEEITHSPEWESNS